MPSFFLKLVSWIKEIFQTIFERSLSLSLSFTIVTFANDAHESKKTERSERCTVGNDTTPRIIKYALNNIQKTSSDIVLIYQMCA